MASYLYGRDVVSDAKDTLSSWDKCMDKTYCKWPVIVAIVVGCLILFSVLYCVARCICCGVELCSCCVSCFTCCGSCCKGGGRSRDRPSKYTDDYSRMPPTPYQGYQPAPSPMAYGGVGNANAPQFATFDDPSSKKVVNEDSLPPMPSWDTAVKRRVEDTSAPPEAKNGDLEMGRLDSQPQWMRGGYNRVPNAPVSPNPAQPEYFHNDSGMNHAYNSDLGDQRLLSHNENHDFQAVPLSPPPTYRSNSSLPSLVGHQFGGNAAAMTTPKAYNHGQQYPPQSQSSYQGSYAPSSTQYEPSHQDYMSESNRISMPTPYNPGPTAQPQAPYPPSDPSPRDNRPPSFLQIGRKPVQGSFREL
ncbi:hypothetical protein A1O7_09158 [Cladophialophora yegresii CBS 114405]|uniref:Fibroin-3 related protein n=1 Tax=Cladophialophora yegresii CBS 114405 TaxID=1182544 RepID=W9VDX7_9EURO|nr:uncharacterized protein A1O7_09158 [Cladophialophora yegresii CBS 114405]EXJ53822.1 hypothetical protein A1O7_09158 [Cladophialophora yegresii CBS 114405]